MKRLLILALFLFASSPAFAQCSNTAYGAFTCKQSCNGHGSAETSQTCVFGSNLTSGSMVYVAGSNISNSTSTLSFSGCGLTWTNQDGSVTGAGAVAAHASAPNNGSAACTITFSTTGAGASLQVLAVEVTGSNQTVDKHSMARADAVPVGNNISGSSLTTTVNGDFVMESAQGYSQGGDVFTAGSGTVLVQSVSDGMAIQGQVQSTSGTINPTMTSNKNNEYFLVGNLAIKPNGGAAAPKGITKKKKLEKIDLSFGAL